MRESLLITLYTTLSLICLLRVWRSSHLSFDCSSVMLIDQFFVTVLPANFWTLSKVAISFLRWGSHTAEQYSSFGNIVELMTFRRTSGGAWWNCRWMSPICRLAALHVELIWSDHVRLEDRVTPRYFTVGEGGISWPSILRWMEIRCLDLVTLSSLVLEWSGVRPWEMIHCSIVSTSFCRCYGPSRSWQACTEGCCLHTGLVWLLVRVEAWRLSS